ncbi:RNA polymerase sigma factor, partial [candidate division WWE3 bacterium]|nr:RNA polymerase sigma factor [candidate division WWE3 bacterium]
MSRKQTFEQVYNNCSLPLRKFISRKIGYDQTIVDDVFQETFLAAYKSWDTFENKSKYLTWLCRISLNKIADYYRKNIHENSRLVVPLANVFDLFFSHDLTPEEQTVLDELKGQLRTCLNLMPPE